MRREIVRKVALHPPWVAVLALAVLVVEGCGGSTPPGARLYGPGQGADGLVTPAPDFSFTGLDGKTYGLADLKGTPVMLNFWSSSCHICASAAPVLEELYQENKADNLVVLGVAGFDSEKALRRKVRALGISYPIAISREAGEAYGVRGIPITFFINREGELVSSILGAYPKSDFDAELQKIL